VKIGYKSVHDKFILIPLGDLHVGNKGCDIKRIKDMVEWIRTKENCFVLCMGDYCDCINYTDPRFDPQTVPDKYLQDLSNAVAMQTEDFIEIIRPISDKIIGFHRGNHEELIRSKYHWDVMHEIHKAFPSVPILNDAAITRLHFTRHKTSVTCFDVFSQHGRVGGMKGGNKINRLEDMMGFVDADIYLIAHAHIKESEVKTQLCLDKSLHVHHKKKLLGVTGSFLRGYCEGSGSYVEKWMLPPTDLGVIRITIVPESGDLHVSI